MGRFPASGQAEQVTAPAGRVAAKISMSLVHGIAALIFAALGLPTLFNFGSIF